MKLIAAGMLSACGCMAAIGNFRVLGTTATQALISYTAPDDNACTIQLSHSATLTPLALDVDPGTFASSNSDLSRPSTVTSGLSRAVTLGQRTAQYATAGTYSGVRHFSRALQTYTPYYGQITCPSTGDTVSFTFTTDNIQLGQTYGDPWLSDPSHPGDQPWPEYLAGLTPESFIDPLTGAFLYRFSLRGNAWTFWTGPFGSAYNLGQTSPCDTAGPWNSPCNVTAGSGNTTVGTSSAPLVIRPFLNANYGTSWYGSFSSIDQLSVALTGYINSATTNFRVLDICLSLNGGASCASSTAQMTMGQSSSQQTVGQAPASGWVPAQFGTIPWLLDTNPRFNMQEASPHSGTATVSGNVVANNPSASGYPGSDLFSLYWIAGGNGHIRLSTNNDACLTPPASTTSTEYAITGFVDGSHLTVAGTPPSGNVYWCENNFSIVVWRDQMPTDGSTVTLTAASMNIMGSSYPGIPDNGAGTACFNQLVYGGYFCLYGGLVWINPNGPVVAYYGRPQAAGVDGGGNPIANTWSATGAPLPESATIDQTQNQMTFYMTAGDPAGGGPLVIQGAFNPGTTPTQPTVPQSDIGIPQIQNATVASTTPYSVLWNNGMTFTNLTPQTTLTESIVQQMATFDPTFIPSYYMHSATGGWNCGLEGGMSAGVFFFECLSIGSNSPGWVFAFSPGDGNPAHAGQAGGPRIIGAINTFNTPPGPVAPGQGALTGRSIHSYVETGETGWIALAANEYDPINTSATSVPASGPQPCTYYGLAGNTNDCVLIDINSHTVGSVTGYEPYFAFPLPPFLGTPGELRTTQIGDTACVTAATATSCTWYDQVNELMTLKIKNYGGTVGAWVFQRDTYGTEKAVTGPISLWWESYQSSISPTSVSISGAVDVYWNPLTGCGGAPDPHGNCLIEDPNECHNHGEWRSGGEAQTTNVPEWKVPGAAEGMIDWPNVYQTLIGSVPPIVEYPPANDTPYAVPGVNYVLSSPPFGGYNGAYGVPFQPDGGSHPNSAGANAGPYESVRAFDNTPIQGGSYDPPFSLVSGQLYYYRPGTVTDPDDFYTAGTTASINRKLMATGAACGAHPLIDVSGPGSTMATGTSSSYTYCAARTGGECYQGSLAGDMYVNCPGVLYKYCSGVATHGGTPLGIGNDICVGNIAKEANGVTQFTLDRTDYTGAFSRVLVSATSRVRMVTGFENNALLPDNSWLLYRQEFLSYQRPEMWMAKYPPYPPGDPGESVNRGTFVPMVVTANPTAGLGATNAVVQFGYQEYGAPQRLDCTTRNDACLAVAATVPAGTQPFYFASENPAGMPCAAGCSIAIPAISQRILYYQVKYRNASNAVVGADPVVAVAVP